MVTNADTASEKTAPAKGGTAGYFAFMAIAIILLYIFNNISANHLLPIDPSLTTYYPGWVVWIVENLASAHVPYLTRYFLSCLWAINLCLAFCILGNFFLLLHRPRWFHHLVMMVISALVILAIYVVYAVFPFDITSSSTQTLVRIILWVIMAIAGAALVLRLVQLIIALKERPLAAPPDLSTTMLSTDASTETQTAVPADQTEIPRPVEQIEPPVEREPPESPPPQV